MLDLLFGGRRLIFKSGLSVEEATARLQREIAEPKRRIVENPPQSFIGTLADGRFHVARVQRGRRSSLWIDGTLSRGAIGCHVDVRLKMPVFAVAACLPVMAFGLFFALGFFLLPGLVLVLAPVVIPITEARKATRLLATLFEAAPSRPIAVGRAIRP